MRCHYETVKRVVKQELGQSIAKDGTVNSLRGRPRDLYRISDYTRIRARISEVRDSGDPHDYPPRRDDSALLAAAEDYLFLASQQERWEDCRHYASFCERLLQQHGASVTSQTGRILGNNVDRRVEVVRSVARVLAETSLSAVAADLPAAIQALAAFDYPPHYALHKHLALGLARKAAHSDRNSTDGYNDARSDIDPLLQVDDAEARLVEVFVGRLAQWHSVRLSGSPDARDLAESIVDSAAKVVPFISSDRTRGICETLLGDLLDPPGAAVAVRVCLSLGEEQWLGERVVEVMNSTGLDLAGAVAEWYLNVAPLNQLNSRSLYVLFQALSNALEETARVEFASRVADDDVDTFMCLIEFDRDLDLVPVVVTRTRRSGADALAYLLDSAGPADFMGHVSGRPKKR